MQLHVVHKHYLIKKLNDIIVLVVCNYRVVLSAN